MAVGSFVVGPISANRSGWGNPVLRARSSGINQPGSSLDAANETRRATEHLDGPDSADIWFGHRLQKHHVHLSQAYTLLGRTADSYAEQQARLALFHNLPSRPAPCSTSMLPSVTPPIATTPLRRTPCSTVLAAVRTTAQKSAGSLDEALPPHVVTAGAHQWEVRRRTRRRRCQE